MPIELAKSRLINRCEPPRRPTAPLDLNRKHPCVELVVMRLGDRGLFRAITSQEIAPPPPKDRTCRDEIITSEPCRGDQDVRVLGNLSQPATATAKRVRAWSARVLRFYYLLCFSSANAVHASRAPFAPASAEYGFFGDINGLVGLVAGFGKPFPLRRRAASFIRWRPRMRAALAVVAWALFGFLRGLPRND